MNFNNINFENHCQWFKILFGFDEDPSSIEENIELKAEDGEIMMKSKINQKTYSVGNFQIRSISSFSHLSKIGGGTLNILCGNGTMKTVADIMISETHPLNDGATFQIASNFNCLDHIPGHKPPSGRCCDYITAHEQGAPGAVVCGPALIYRHYLLPHDGVIGQLLKDINLMEKCPLVIVDGYVKGYAEGANDFDWEDEENYAIGVHSNISATMGRSGPNFENYRIVENQNINQVFCSTLANGVIRNCDLSEKIIINTLKAEYKATILAAWENSLKYPGKPGSKKCYLTTIGGGCFRVPLKLIGEAIKEAKQTIIDSGLEVYVVCFNSSVKKALLPILNSVVDETKGQVVDL